MGKLNTMPLRYATPRALIQALHDREDGARQQLQQRVGASVTQLVGAFLKQHALEHEPDLLGTRALHAVELYLRTRPLAQFDAMSWRAFHAAVLFHLGRLACKPFEGAAARGPRPAALPDVLAYPTRTLFLPFEKVGLAWCSGDWCGGTRASDGSLWIAVADVTGHGYPAYLLASNLAGVWRLSWEGLASDCCQPAEVLAALHALLADCLPEGVYVECTLARFKPDGEVVVAAAGGSRLLVRRGNGGEPVTCHTRRGAWLGLAAPDPADQSSLTLADGDELLLASDGLYDQLAIHAGSVAASVRRLAEHPDSGSLFDTVETFLNEALRGHPQRDDVTVVSVRRHVPALASAGGAPPLTRKTTPGSS